MRRQKLSVVLLLCIAWSPSAPAEETESIASAGTASLKLYCKSRGSTAVMSVVNAGERKSDCFALCAWQTDTATMHIGTGFDIGKNERAEKWSKDLGAPIIGSRYASLSCDKPVGARRRPTAPRP